MLQSPEVLQYQSRSKLNKSRENGVASSNASLKRPAQHLLINDQQLLYSAPNLGAKRPHAPNHAKRPPTAVPRYLQPETAASTSAYTGSIVSFDDSPMTPARRRRHTYSSRKEALTHRGLSSAETSDDESGGYLVTSHNDGVIDDDSDDVMQQQVHDDGGPPDGGFGWIVVLASFCMQALTGGIAYVQGLMYPQFLEAMGADPITTAWACSMQMSIWFTGGLVAGPLVQIYGARRIASCGTIIIFLGLVISAFATHIWMLYVFYGFLCGLGMSMIFFPAVIIVQHYFTKKRSIAVSFANAGTPFGAFLYPIIVSYLINTFGWRGELIIVAALTLNGLVFASFFRPVQAKTKPKAVGNTASPPQVKPKPREVTLLVKEAHGEPMTAKQRSPDLTNNARGDSTPTDRSVPEMIISSVVSLGQVSLTDRERSKLKAFLKNLVDLSLWKNPNMVLDVFAYGLFAFGFILPSMFLPLKAQANDILPPRPEILLSVMGFSDVIGRLTSGLIGAFLGRKRLVIYGVGMAICGTASILSSFLHDFWQLCVYTVIFGLCTGMSRAYSSVVVTDMLGIKNLPKAYGFKMFINGICVLNSGPLAAFIFEATGSLDYSFMIIGAIQVGGSMLVFILLALRASGCAEVI